MARPPRSPARPMPHSPPSAWSQVSQMSRARLVSTSRHHASQAHTSHPEPPARRYARPERAPHSSHAPGLHSNPALRRI
jgi:hypothetical protein